MQMGDAISPAVDGKASAAQGDADLAHERPFLSGGLGTWTNRQTRLLSTVLESGGSGRTGSGACSAEDPPGEDTDPPAAAEVPPSAGTLVAQALLLHHQQMKEAREAKRNKEGDDEMQDAAWRWRFAKRWHAEQLRPIDANASMPSDNVSSAHSESTDLGSLNPNGSLVNAMLLDDDDSMMSRRGSQTLHSRQHLGEATKE
eukprot:gene25457-11116_t